MAPTAPDNFVIETGRAMKRAFADPATQASFDEWRHMRAEIATLEAEVARLREQLHDCRNELCWLCGKYRDNPTCDCRWKEA